MCEGKGNDGGSHADQIMGAMTHVRLPPERDAAMRPLSICRSPVIDGRKTVGTDFDMNNADLIVATLKAAGIRRGFGIPSGNVLPLMEAMRKGGCRFCPHRP